MQDVELKVRCWFSSRSTSAYWYGSLRLRFPGSCQGYSRVGWRNAVVETVRADQHRNKKVRVRAVKYDSTRLYGTSSVPHCRQFGYQSWINRFLNRGSIRLFRSQLQLSHLLQDLVEQKRTKYKINGHSHYSHRKTNPNRLAKSRLPYSYQDHEQGEQQRQPRDSRQLSQSVT